MLKNQYKKSFQGSRTLEPSSRRSSTRASSRGGHCCHRSSILDGIYIAFTCLFPRRSSRISPLNVHNEDGTVQCSTIGSDHLSGSAAVVDALPLASRDSRLTCCHCIFQTLSSGPGCPLAQCPELQAGGQGNQDGDRWDCMVPTLMLKRTLPYHFLCDDQLRILQIGSGLTKLLGGPKNKYGGSHMSAHFMIEQPVIKELVFSSFISKTDSSYILKLKRDFNDASLKQDELRVKGQMIHCSDTGCLLFVGSPLIDGGLEAMTRSGLFLSDIPIHDATRDLILVEEQSKAQEGLKRRMEQLRLSIQQANRLVAEERKKNVDLLNLIFPAKVARQLWLGHRVEAEHFEQVTLLFSDIVGFTSICSTATPFEVINMLSKLYTQFDTFCEELDVYKTETIGDAYCVAAGLHRSIGIHAQQAAWMALKMIETVQTVCALDGKPLQMRIGLHTSSVVAGIVGVKMPRYCLFGNNVTLANKFEATSEPLRINISPTTHRLLSKSTGFSFTERQSSCLPPSYPATGSDTCYFLDGFKCSSLETGQPLTEHIRAAMAAETFQSALPSAYSSLNRDSYSEDAASS
ncbi:Guanylate cyclase soluble subunit alpha-1 [Halotydeus destructor]|nr:Guanylate cyclase soluble subunit alpha-1 [Halotydeus destructor]